MCCGDFSVGVGVVTVTLSIYLYMKYLDSEKLREDVREHRRRLLESDDADDDGDAAVAKATPNDDRKPDKRVTDAVGERVAGESVRVRRGSYVAPPLTEKLKRAHDLRNNEQRVNGHRHHRHQHDHQHRTETAAGREDGRCSRSPSCHRRKRIFSWFYVPSISSRLRKWGSEPAFAGHGGHSHCVRTTADGACVAPTAQQKARSSEYQLLHTPEPCEDSNH